MQKYLSKRWFLILGILVVGAIGVYIVQNTLLAPPPVNYSTDIKPILNKKCIACHGGVKKNGGFSLLFEEEAKGPTKSGHPAIIPGKPGRSEMIKRITSDDPAYRMPPEGAALTEREINLMTRWVDEGAKWGKHWAFVKPEPIEPPVVEKAQGKVGEASNWVKNDIDRFVLARLQEEQTQPSEQADCTVLLRRVSLDLTGVPPTPEQVAAFCENPTDEKYAAFVDTLLASPNFGERWAAMWLDLARYADTKGYERDVHREIWRYRDWVIKAFNDDMPFDQFTIEQLAGDLLPNPTPEQYTATAFHRNTMNNDEGGTDNEEYRVMAILDRVNTTWDVWQATTFSCVQCHSHPYDPFRHEEYYQSYAFFNNTRDEDIFAETPNYKFLQPADSTKLEEVKNWIAEYTPDNSEQQLLQDMEHFIHITEPKVHPHHFDSLKNAAHADTKFLQLREDGSARLVEAPVDKKLYINFLGVRKGGVLKITKADGTLVGKMQVTDGMKGYHKFPLQYDFEKGELPTLYFSFTNPADESAVCTISWLNFRPYLPGNEQKGFTKIQENIIELLNAETDKVPIMIENKGAFERETHVFERGNWLVHGKEVQPGTPSSLPPMPEDAPRNRLGFARWLVSEDNPLTARVFVNRIWEQVYGIGIVETVEDFGTQSEAPSHPELLDWLALQFMEEHNWSLKSLLRQIVTSATYQQSSKVNAEILEKDPRNRLLARGPRIRLTAEQVRDQALAVSGLLSDKMYGKSVMPPQPEGVWQTVYNGNNWEESTGENRYRRAIYTYWKRTSPYPSMMAFDTPSREFCLPRRISTNTPLQALVTLNDPVYVEAAIHLAQRTDAKDTEAAIRDLYYQAIFEQPTDRTMATLQTVYTDAKTHFENNPEAIAELFNHAIEPPQPDIELAARTVVANTIMNLDAFMTKS